MFLHHRSMQPRDVRECVEIMATHPVVGPRYAASLDNLRRAWLDLLGREAFKTRILEERRAAGVRISFVGVSVCVHDRFIDEMKRQQSFWVGPELAIRSLRDDSPVLTDRELRAANTSGGLNCLVWAGYFRPELEKQSTPYLEMMDAFIEIHRGYLWKEVVASEIESPERLHWTINSGGMLWDTKKGRYVGSLEREASEIMRAPHVVGITRELESKRPCSWVGALFRYHSPQLGFRHAEQQMLHSALNGLTDEELADTLRVSLPTIKKNWLSIYERVHIQLPGVLPDQTGGNGNRSRGREKRRRLLEYLRHHPEELRPILRKLVR